MTFSLITITLNSARTVAATIDSVLRQGCADLEYIVIDGGSTDGTCDIVESYGKYITKFISGPDEGIADAFNKGLKRATGDIIGILNSDDELLDGTLSRIAYFFEARPKVQVVHGDILLYDNDHFVKKVSPPRYWWYPWRLIVLNHPATFVRKEVYGTCGVFDKKLSYAMDIDMYLRWLNAGIRVEYLPEPLARMRSGGVGGRNAYAAFAEGRRVMIVNGYSPLLATVQYYGRCAVQGLLACRNKFARL